jgi:hypothetical protein
MTQDPRVYQLSLQVHAIWRATRSTGDYSDTNKTIDMAREPAKRRKALGHRVWLMSHARVKLFLKAAEIWRLHAAYAYRRDRHNWKEETL